MIKIVIINIILRFLEYPFLASIIGYNVVTDKTQYGKKKLGDEDGYEIYKSKRENYKK